MSRNALVVVSLVVAAAVTSALGRPTADGVNDFDACSGDIDKFCSGFHSLSWEEWAEEYGYTTASWKLGLVECLASNDVTEECASSQARRDALNDALVEACEHEMADFCYDVEPTPGSEPLVDCLWGSYSELGEPCAAALDAHEAAKPEGA